MGSYWDNLSMREKMAFMKVGLDNGLTDVRSIRDAYNKFAAGGSKKTVAVAPQAPSTAHIPSLSRKYYAPMNSTPARNTFIPTNTRSLGGRIRRRRARKFSGEDDDNPTQLMPFDDSYAEGLGTTPISVNLGNTVNAAFPSLTYDEAMAIKKRMAAMGDDRELVGTMPDIEVIAQYLTPEQSAYIHSPALQLAQQDKPLESVYPEAVLLSLGRAGWTSPSLYKAAWSGAKDLGKAVINPGGVADAMFSSAPTLAAPSIPILGATTPAGIAVNALGIGLPAAEAAQYVFSPHGLREANWKSPEPYMQGLALAPLVGAGVGRAATAIPRAWNASLNAFRNRYGFVQTPNSFTRGIGGEPGLQDLVQSGVIRGNVRGTEFSPQEWNPEEFKTAEQALETRFPGITERYYRRQLTKEEFEAIKARAQEKAAEQAAAAAQSETSGKKKRITLRKRQHGVTSDALDYADTYDEYLADMKRGGATYDENYPREKGHPMPYFYDDGRDPISAGHSYATSDYGVKIDNVSDYSPYIHPDHLHYTTSGPVSLFDPNVTVYGNGPFGMTAKLNKETMNTQLFDDLTLYPLRKKLGLPLWKNAIMEAAANNRPSFVRQAQALTGGASNLGGAASTNASPLLTVPLPAIRAVENNLEIARQIAKERQLVDLDMHSIMYPDPNNPTDINVDLTTSPMTRFGPMDSNTYGFYNPEGNQYPQGIALNANWMTSDRNVSQILLHEKHHALQDSPLYPHTTDVDLSLYGAYPTDPLNRTEKASNSWYERASTNAEVRRYLLSKGFKNAILNPNFTDDYLAKQYPLVIKDQDGNVTTVFHAMVNDGNLPSVYMRDYNAGIRDELESGLTPHLSSKAIWHAVRTVPALLGGGIFTGAMLQNNTGDATTATNGQIRALGGNLFGEGSYMDPPPQRQIATVGDFSLGKDLSIHSDEHPYIADAINMATGMIPVVGDIQDIAAMIDNPSWANAGQLALDAVSYVPGLRWMKLVSKPVRKAAAVESAYKAANKVAPGRQRKAALRKVREENGELKSKTQRKNSAERKAVIENATKKGKKIQTGTQVASGVASGIDSN